MIEKLKFKYFHEINGKEIKLVKFETGHLYFFDSAKRLTFFNNMKKDDTVSAARWKEVDVLDLILNTPIGDLKKIISVLENLRFENFTRLGDNPSLEIYSRIEKELKEEILVILKETGN